MTENRQIAELRSALLTELNLANAELAKAQQRVAIATQRLRSLDDVLSAVGNRQPEPTEEEDEQTTRVYTKGRTLAIRNAITSFRGREFTPTLLRKRIHELQPDAAFLFPDVTAVTRVLNKMLAVQQPTIKRASKGAGIKEPFYKAT